MVFNIKNRLPFLVKLKTHLKSAFNSSFKTQAFVIVVWGSYCTIINTIWTVAELYPQGYFFDAPISLCWIFLGRVCHHFLLAFCLFKFFYHTIQCSEGIPFHAKLLGDGIFVCLLSSRHLMMLVTAKGLACIWGNQGWHSSALISWSLVWL